MERASPSQSATEKGEEHRGREKGWSSQLTESRAFCGFTPRSHQRTESQTTTGSYTCGAQLPKTSLSVLQCFRKATPARNTQCKELNNLACTRENNVTLSPTGNRTVTAVHACAHLQTCPVPRPPPTSSSQHLSLLGHQTFPNAGEQRTLQFTFQ